MQHRTPSAVTCQGGLSQVGKDLLVPRSTIFTNVPEVPAPLPLQNGLLPTWLGLSAGSGDQAVRVGQAPAFDTWFFSPTSGPWEGGPGQRTSKTAG